ncbi:pilus assembly protein TadG-related protein [Kribbella sp. NPDC051587]|uniref:pilus assembly protein TadG-related protein n=1 Tax=Kribbella sp. NPDC051587 TaxID=3364119 RepID=UPI00378B47C5
MSRPRRKRDEQGQITVLIIGFTFVILLMIVVVTDISKVFLVRRDLDATADGAVLAAANGLAAIYTQPAADGNAEVDPDQARRLTAEYLDQVAASNRFDGLDWSADVTGATVTVQLTSSVDLPFQPPGFPGSADIATEASAVVPIR